ncbi:MAG: hypothetical protein ACPGUU_07205 [Flavobacteriaceae bacterium]
MRKQNTKQYTIFSKLFSSKKTNNPTKDYKDYSRLVDHFMTKLQVE